MPMPKPTRTQALVVALLTAIGAGFALVPVRGQQKVHRYSFGGKHPALVRGDANVRAEEKEHDISDQAFKSQPTSEHIRLTAEAGVGDAAFIHYHYDTPPAPVSPALSAGVWVKATKPGVQLRARVVFPKEPDPARPEAPLTMLIVGDTYDKTRGWQKLTLTDVPELVGKHLPVLQTKIGRAVNTNGAYVDRLILNVYTGPGTADIWIDDLDIGPIKGPDGAAPGGAPGVPAKLPKPPVNEPGTGPRGRVAEQRGGQLFVDSKPFFFRMVRHTGVPLHVLRQAGFDALWVPADVSAETLADANREGWMVVPAAPLMPAATGGDPGAASAAQVAVDNYLRKFGNADVLFWDLGGGRRAEQADSVLRTTEYIRKTDNRRPRGADVWDGFGTYSTFVEVVGAHRWPLFTSLEFNQYRLWLEQRQDLSAKHIVFWTWVQNHLPEWYLTSVLGQKEGDAFAEPIGPHPEQVRQLAYIGIGCGCRGLGFWSDRFLADSHHGRGRLQGMAILNAELEMLAPVLLAPQRDRPAWLRTSHPSVQAALINTSRGTLLIPIWMGAGAQFVPEQAALPSLKITVPLVAEGAEPWRITPAGVECLRNSTLKVSGGTELTITEFDLATPIVFTNDLSANGLVVWWQDYARKYGRLAARWAMDLAAEEYEKTLHVHKKLTEMGVVVRGADKLLEQAMKFHEDARRNFAAELYDKAFADAHRALRPLRVIMRDHWRQATATLDIPTASPYAVSFYSLPKHWELFLTVQASRPGENVLPNGSFDPVGAVPPGGIPVNDIPGWGARYGTLDAVNVAAGVIPATKLDDKFVPKPEPKQPKLFEPSRALPGNDDRPPGPELGRGVLKLEVRQRNELGKDGKPLIDPTRPLERTFLAVDSPVMRLPPGTLVRVSGWVKVVGAISHTADGALFYDDAGGEQLGVRVLTTNGEWKKFHLYRYVPASGQIGVTVALTGVGVAYFDDIRIEPLVPAAGYGPAPGRPAQPGTPRPAPPTPVVPLVPAGGIRR